MYQFRETISLGSTPKSMEQVRRSTQPLHACGSASHTQRWQDQQQVREQQQQQLSLRRAQPWTGTATSNNSSSCAPAVTFSFCDDAQKHRRLPNCMTDGLEHVCAACTCCAGARHHPGAQADLARWAGFAQCCSASSGKHLAGSASQPQLEFHTVLGWPVLQQLQRCMLCLAGEAGS